MMKRKQMVLALAAISLSAAAQSPNPVGPTETADRAVIQNRSEGPSLTFSERNPRYRLQVGDVIDLAFPFTPEFNQTVTIQPDGFITLREVGDTKVQGQTIPELRDTLRQQYSKILREPEIRVDLKDFEKPFFIAGGEVKQPGKYELRRVLTVAEAVSVAGGFNEGAKHTEVLLFRRLTDEWVEVRKINVKHVLANAALNEDVSLRPGDMIYVPKTQLASLKNLLMPRIVLGPTLRPGF
jgi:polysaccharide export outer membrane protein